MAGSSVARRTGVTVDPVVCHAAFRRWGTCVISRERRENGRIGPPAATRVRLAERRHDIASPLPAALQNGPRRLSRERRENGPKRPSGGHSREAGGAPSRHRKPPTCGFAKRSPAPFTRAAGKRQNQPSGGHSREARAHRHASTPPQALNIRRAPSQAHAWRNKKRGALPGRPALAC